MARTSQKRVDRSIAQLRIRDPALGEQDTPIVKNKVSNAKTKGVIPVIGSEATLWAPLGLGN